MKELKDGGLSSARDTEKTAARIPESETDTTTNVVGVGISIDDNVDLTKKQRDTEMEDEEEKSAIILHELDDGGLSEEVNEERVAAITASDTDSTIAVGVGIDINTESDLVKQQKPAVKYKEGVEDAIIQSLIPGAHPVANSNPADSRDKSGSEPFHCLDFLTKTEADKSQQPDHHIPPPRLTGTQDDSAPRTSLTRGHGLFQQSAGIPGAHARGGGFINLTDERASMSSSEHDSTTSDHTTPVANLVDEDEEAGLDLPRATSMETRPSNANGTWHHEKKILLALGAIGLLVVIIVIVVTLSLVGDQNPDNEEIAPPTTAITAAPSMAPTVSVANYYLSLLPDYSVRAVQNDPESPQAQAFEWLLEDVGSHNIVFEDWRIHQRFALACLYYATGGDQWRQRDNWMNHTVHECAWHSEVRNLVTQQLEPMCDEKGVISEFGLPRNNLRNTLPPELFLLTSLRNLVLEYNLQLQGPIPDQVGQLTALARLWIHNMQQGGTIPSQVGRLTNLQALSLSGNGHTGSLPTEFSLLTKLHTLVLGQNDQLTGPVLNTLLSLPQVRRFSIDNNDHSGTIPEEVGQLSNLRWLLLSGNRFHGTLPSTIGLLSNMRVLSLSRNQLEGVLPAELGLLTASTLLSLHTNNFWSTIPSELGNLSNLSVGLTLHKNPLLGGTLPTQLGRFTGLYALDFRENNHTGSIPSELGLLTSLGKLDLSNNELIGTIPEALHTLNQSLYYLDVQGNALLSGSVPQALCQINATCIPSFLRGPCIPAEGAHLAFDNTSLECACDCHNETVTPWN
ncbi:LRR receptor-like serine threonine-protein kinase [Seminavis robusta]|uniref:LRR receptor-like serine threonine-protein kinase n=1 Tax=Seminavis robusta TaxID=568900 RepID=A0A9N8EPB3_9STRA|nr:LRR receptor-like serine threonine-protein kinase [Seminavis robusta]|eukprot:Sro1331_g263500.1 LRR receptor-like serine threonine-protein kinase (794) ;mRNA; f:15711-18185